jgi:hypothetical protein
MWLTKNEWKKIKSNRKPRVPRTKAEWEAAKATMGRRNPGTGARNNCTICHGTAKRKILKKRKKDGTPVYRKVWCRCDITVAQLKEMAGRRLLRGATRRKPSGRGRPAFKPHWLPGRDATDRHSDGRPGARTSTQRNQARRRRQKFGV